MRTSASVLSVSLLAASLAVAQQPAAPQAAPTPAPQAAAPSAAPSGFAAKFDELWPKRELHPSSPELDKLVDQAVAASPNEFDVLWRAAALRTWEADNAQGETKQNLGKAGWDLGERAAKAQPSRVEGHYYAAVGIGFYSEAVGILKALTQGLEGKFNGHLDEAIKLNPAYDFAGPLLTKGRYFYELPWPKRNLGKSTEYLLRAIKVSPVALRPRFYLAETYLKDGKAKEAKQLLDQIAAGDASYNRPEAMLVKAWAKALEPKVAEALR